MPSGKVARRAFAQERTPDAEQALVNLAALRLLDQRRAEARELLERALRINPDNQQARDGLARMGVEL